MVKYNPREWHELLPRVLWDYRTSKTESTQATPYGLVYGKAVVLPIEVIILSHRITRHYDPKNFNCQEALHK